MSIPDTLTIDGEVYVRQTAAKEPESKPWPQEGEVAWNQGCSGGHYAMLYGETDESYLHQGRIHRTEAEAIRANEVEAANAAIKRWRDENCPFVADFTKSGQLKCHSFYDHPISDWGYEKWACEWEVPNVILFASIDDIKRCQSELPDAWAALVGVK